MRRKTKAKRKTGKKCPSIKNMRLTTLKKLSTNVNTEIHRRLAHVGVSKR